MIKFNENMMKKEIIKFDKYFWFEKTLLRVRNVWLNWELQWPSSIFNCKLQRILFFRKGMFLMGDSVVRSTMTVIKENWCGRMTMIRNVYSHEKQKIFEFPWFVEVHRHSCSQFDNGMIISTTNFCIIDVSDDETLRNICNGFLKEGFGAEGRLDVRTRDACRKTCQLCAQPCSPIKVNHPTLLILVFHINKNFF